MMEEGGALDERHRLFAGVDEVGVFGPGRGAWPHAENPVLAVQDDFAIFRKVVRDERRQPDPKVHVGTFRNVPGDAAGHFVPCPPGHDVGAPPAMTTR